MKKPFGTYTWMGPSGWHPDFGTVKTGEPIEVTDKAVFKRNEKHFKKGESVAKLKTIVAKRSK